jgi:nitrate/TMAO reductase-like tetraheme cytochrome c subunit
VPGKVKSRKNKILLALFILAVAAGVAPMSLAQSSSSDFCMSCHEMRGYREELKASRHAVDKDKKAIECAQCHIPNSIGPKFFAVKIFLGIKDIIVHNFGDPQNLNRREMQLTARRFIVDENCLACHPDLNKTADGKKKISEIGRLSHEAYLGKNGTTKRGCAGCHFNMAHLPDFDRRFFFNQKFAANYVMIKERK